jgi:hypothetical protein
VARRSKGSVGRERRLGENCVPDPILRDSSVTGAGPAWGGSSMPGGRRAAGSGLSPRGMAIRVGVPHLQDPGIVATESGEFAVIAFLAAAQSLSP